MEGGAGVTLEVGVVTGLPVSLPNSLTPANPTVMPSATPPNSVAVALARGFIGPSVSTAWSCTDSFGYPYPLGVGSKVTRTPIEANGPYPSGVWEWHRSNHDADS